MKSLADHDVEKQAKRTILRCIPIFVSVALGIGMAILWIMSTDKGIGEAGMWLGLAFIPFSGLVLFAALIGCFFKQTNVYCLALFLTILGFYGGLALGYQVFLPQ